MRRMQRCVLLCVMSLRSRGVFLLLRHPVLPHNLATHGAARREGRQDTAALRYCCTIAFLEVSEFQQLPRGAITSQYKCIKLISVHAFTCFVSKPTEHLLIKLFTVFCIRRSWEFNFHLHCSDIIPLLTQSKVWTALFYVKMCCIYRNLSYVSSEYEWEAHRLEVHCSLCFMG
jgi:hypothetical protein